MAKKKNEIHKVFLSQQPVINDSSSINRPDEVGKVILGGRVELSGESSSYGDGDKFELENQKISSMRIMSGTGKSLWTQLKKLTNQLPNGPYMMDSGNGGIKIHNHNFNQSTKLHYTYAGGNGELLSVSFKTQKKTKPLIATESSKIDPETKAVDTSVKQSLEYPWRQYQVMSEEDRNSRGLSQHFRPNIDMNPAGNFSMEDVTKGIARGRQPKPKNLSTKQLQMNMYNRYKFEKEAANEIAQNYRVTQEDINRMLQQAKSNFEKYLGDAKKGGSLEPLLKSNSMGKLVVKKRQTVKEWINPYDYANQEGGGPEHPKGSYDYGLDVIKSNPNIVVLDKITTRSSQVGFKDEQAGLTDLGYRPKVLAILDKDIEIDVDGARVFAAATPQQIADLYSNNDLVTANIKQVIGQLITVGRPELCTSMVIELANISKKYSGGWYTKKVKHSFTPGAGYKCDAEIIRKANPVDIITTHSRVHTPSLYKEINQIAKDKVADGIIDTSSEVKQVLDQYYKENPGKKDTNIGVTVKPVEGGEKLEIWPASEEKTNITNVRNQIKSKK